MALLSFPQENKLFCAPQRFNLYEPMNPIDTRLRDFVVFCVERRGNSWPALYDEMAYVAGQHLFEGLGYSELRQLGLSLSIVDLEDTIRLVEQITSQDQQT